LPVRGSTPAARPRLATAGGLALGLAVGWNIANTGAVARGLADAYGTSLAAIGLLTTALFATHFATQIPGGRLIDRVGARRGGLAGIVLLVAGNALALTSASFPLALAARLVVGVGVGLGFVAGADYVRSATSSPAAQGLYGGAAIGGGGLAIALVPLLGGPLGWRSPYVTALVAAAVLGFVLGLGPPDERRPRVLEQPGVRSLLRESRLYPLASLHVASFSVSVLAGNWIVELLEDRGYPRATAAAVGSLLLLLGFFTRPLEGWLLRARPRLGRLLVPTSVASGAVALAVLARPAPLAVLVVAAALAGLAAGVPFAAVFAGAQRVRPDAPAAAVGLVNAVATLTILAVNPLIGLAFSSSPGRTISFLALAAACGAGLPAARAFLTPPREGD
jgi:MFS transporter, NNP family, nitrate/nitrite transporter